MNLKKIDEIKRIALISMFSDDDLMDVLVLKGGNALDIVYGISPRASIDLDFSIAGDFQDSSLIETKIRNTLIRTFNEKGYVAFDINMFSRPHIHSPK